MWNVWPNIFLKVSKPMHIDKHEIVLIATDIKIDDVCWNILAESYY